MVDTFFCSNGSSCILFGAISMQVLQIHWYVVHCFTMINMVVHPYTITKVFKSVQVSKMNPVSDVSKVFKMNQVSDVSKVSKMNPVSDVSKVFKNE